MLTTRYCYVTLNYYIIKIMNYCGVNKFLCVCGGGGLLCCFIIAKGFDFVLHDVKQNCIQYAKMISKLSESSWSQIQ